MDGRGIQSIGEPRQPLFSIGHSNQSVEAFVELLRLHRIDVLADVRSRPYSKYVAHFNGPPLKEFVEKSGIRYLFLGKELGGRPDGMQFYDADGHVLYGRVAEANFFLEGIARLEKGTAKYRVAIMCSEEDPAVCHRHLLIGRVLGDRGVGLHHIRGDGAIELDSAVAERSAGAKAKNGKKAAGLQMALLPELEEEREASEWRSLRSVLRRDPHASSSDPSDDPE